MAGKDWVVFDKMLVEAMLIAGTGFTALVGVAGAGYFDQAAENAGWQEKGDLEKWQNNNEFAIEHLVDTEDIVEDLKTDFNDMMGGAGSDDESETESPPIDITEEGRSISA